MNIPLGQPTIRKGLERILGGGIVAAVGSGAIPFLRNVTPELIANFERYDAMGKFDVIALNTIAIGGLLLGAYGLYKLGEGVYTTALATARHR